MIKNPNRIVAYAIAIFGLATALLPIVTATDWQTTAGVIAGLTAATAVALKWLDGWQQNVERPEVQASLIQFQAATQAEEISRASEAAKQAAAPRKPTIGLPR